MATKKRDIPDELLSRLRGPSADRDATRVKSHTSPQVGRNDKGRKLYNEMIVSNVMRKTTNTKKK